MRMSALLLVFIVSGRLMYSGALLFWHFLAVLFGHVLALFSRFIPTLLCWLIPAPFLIAAFLFNNNFTPLLSYYMTRMFIGSAAFIFIHCLTLVFIPVLCDRSLDSMTVSRGLVMTFFLCLSVTFSLFLNICLVLIA